MIRPKFPARRTRAPRAIAASIVAAALLIAGCGADDQQGDPAGQDPPQSVTQAPAQQLEGGASQPGNGDDDGRDDGDRDDDDRDDDDRDDDR